MPIEHGNTIRNGECVMKQKEFTFTKEAESIPYPDLRHYKGMMKNIKTPVCGKLREYCDLITSDCNVYCNKNGANPSELCKNDVEGRDIIL